MVGSVNSATGETQTNGLLWASKGKPVCVRLCAHTHSCMLRGEHLASETTKASPQLSRTAGADRHCVAKLHKGSSLWRGEEKGLTFLNLFVQHQETVITLVVQSRQKKLTSKAT